MSDLLTNVKSLELETLKNLKSSIKDLDGSILLTTKTSSDLVGDLPFFATLMSSILFFP